MKDPKIWLNNIKGSLNGARQDIPQAQQFVNSISIVRKKLHLVQIIFNFVHMLQEIDATDQKCSRATRGKIYQLRQELFSPLWSTIGIGIAICPQCKRPVFLYSPPITDNYVMENPDSGAISQLNSGAANPLLLYDSPPSIWEASLSIQVIIISGQNYDFATFLGKLLHWNQGIDVVSLDLLKTW